MLRYKLRTTTVAVNKEANHPITVLIPAGAIVESFGNAANASGFVEVEWKGVRIEVFAVDLHTRGEPIREVFET